MLQLTDKPLSNITVIEEDIEKVTQNLDSNKAQEQDMISMRMLKICGKSIIKPLQIIYKQCLDKGCFPDELKKANVVPIHKKLQTVTVKLSTNISIANLR